MRVTFYCDIVNLNGEVIEKDFDFDACTFDSQDDLDRYMRQNRYAEGEICGYWGNDKGILTDVVIED